MSKWLFSTQAALNQVSPRPAVKPGTHRACLSLGPCGNSLTGVSSDAGGSFKPGKGRAVISAAATLFIPTISGKKGPGWWQQPPHSVPSLRGAGLQQKLGLFWCLSSAQTEFSHADSVALWKNDAWNTINSLPTSFTPASPPSWKLCEHSATAAPQPDTLPEPPVLPGGLSYPTSHLAASPAPHPRQGLPCSPPAQRAGGAGQRGMKRFGSSPICCGLGLSPGGLFLAPADSFGKWLPLPKPQPGAIPNSCLEKAENGLGMALPWLSWRCWRGDGSGAGWALLGSWNPPQGPLTLLTWRTTKKTWQSLCRVSEEEQGSGEAVTVLSPGVFPCNPHGQSGMDVKFPPPIPKRDFGALGQLVFRNLPSEP